LEADMETIVDYIDQVIMDRGNEARIAGIKQKVHEMMGSRPLFKA